MKKLLKNMGTIGDGGKWRYKYVTDKFSKVECETGFIGGIRTPDTCLTVELAPTLLVLDYLFGRTEAKTFHVCAELFD